MKPKLQLNEIRKVKLSTIFCDNGDDIDSMQVIGSMILKPLSQQPVAGVRDGVAGQRDQPASSVQVRRSPQDRPQPLERRLLPLGAFPDLPQWLWQEVERLCCSPLVCSSHFLLLVRHARTLSPMSDPQTHL